MNKINITYYNIEQPDGAGMYQEVLVSCKTKEVAEGILKIIKGDWPRKVVKRTYNLELVESVDEYDTINKYKAIKSKKIDELTEDDWKVILKYRGIVN